MWYLLIVAVLAGHIHQKIVVDKPTDQPFRNLEECQKDLSAMKTAKPKKGVTVYLACVEDNPVLDYYGAAEPQRLLREQRGD